MRPIVFQCRQLIPRSTADICAEVADLDRWRTFDGYGILPGIASAVYESRAETMVGSRIRVHNRDGSNHVEEIYRWVPGQAIAMKFSDFSPPLSHLATHFTEEWHFEAQESATLVTRTFHLFPTRSTTRPVLWLISLLFRRAIARHLAEIAQTGEQGARAG